MQENIWRLIDTGFSDAYFNMAVDEVLILSCKKDGAKPVLRFYQWNPSGLSLGYAQKFGDGFSLKNCRDMGIDVVRRITGGQAVFHDCDLTYSVAVPESYLEPPKTERLFKMISNGLMEGLKNLGFKVQPFISETPPRERDEKAYNCFFNRSNYEIAIGGKKLAGSAQRRISGALLQHGSVMLRIDYERMAKVYDDDSGKTEEKISEIKKNITSLAENGEMTPDITDIKKAIIEGFKNLSGIKFIPEPLAPEELSEAKRLAEEKYLTKEWNEVK
ncbi:MAG: hypothetical protein A3G31_11040 [Candidatus Schekmanbacteria bacterium RIFCSPLOWO2_12_FULL_38_15]|uniref:BPL/LPL catalytic domain-containing protein n=1 Tax=Candidatus Schekmanbacteria bacterium RIFCSPLOWO2_12_FULL_38_15 TaxID=1817883 RepID=A0A1F7SFE8_9BACT|nr:MAG: hypothetical protein A3G31_11040 [Candidatus Schekmanbacteria bacterium RIFCSPLOWO2_12_FULL_38_15]